MDNLVALDPGSRWPEQFKGLRVENRGNRYATVWTLTSQRPHFSTGFPHSALAFICELESGKRNISLPILEKYSKAYKVDLFVLIYLAEKKWRVINSSKYTSYKKLQQDYYYAYEKELNEYMKTELEKLLK